MSRRDDLICQNIGLVHSCARRFIGRGIEYDDLFQAGCMGLVKAADGFEALMGWLYLKREWKRMADLIKIGLDHLSECEEEKKQEK